MSSVTDSSNALTKEFAEVVFSSADTHLSRSLIPNLSGTGDLIVSASLDPRAYGNADTFSRDYLCAEMMSKFPYWDLGIDRAGVALEKFRLAEAQCTHANRVLLDFGANSLLSFGCEQVLKSARGKIHHLLGEFSWREAMQAFRFGRGATVGKTFRHRDLTYKVADGWPTCTPGLLNYLYLVRDEFPLWDFEPRIRVGGKITTVPKSAKTDRTICIEPDINILVQLGIGRCIRNRLRRIGLLTKDAQFVNQRAAKEGSITGQLATIDLSMASDTVSKELVRALIRRDWLEPLEAARSPVALLKGSCVPFEKFSTMGNGSNFELETLIFWGICSAIVETHDEWDQRVFVYGDDIIVDARAATLVREVFAEIGLNFNSKKSFADGPFRESCGKHYFLGVDVSPFYVKDTIRGQKWAWAANTVRAHARLEWGLDRRWKRAYDFCVSNLPPVYRRKIPDGYGDGGLVVDFDEACPSLDPSGHEGFLYSTYVEESVQGHRGGFRRLRKSLWLLDRSLPEIRVGSLFFRPDSVGSALPLRQRQVLKEGLLAKQWPSYGPWL